jgi:hypothetical protein
LHFLTNIFTYICSYFDVFIAYNSQPYLSLILKLLEKSNKNWGNQSVGSDGFFGPILKLGGEAMIPFQSILQEISLNNAIIRSDWKDVIVGPI